MDYERTKKYISAICGQLVSILIVVGSTKALSVAFSTESFAIYSFYTILLTLPSVCFFTPLNAGITRLLSLAEKKNESIYIKHLHKRSHLLGFFVFSGAGVASALIAHHYDYHKWVLPLAIVMPTAVLSSFINSIFSNINFSGHFLKATFLETSDKLLFFSVSLTLIWMSTDCPEMVLWARLFVSVFWLFFIKICISKGIILDGQVADNNILASYRKTLLKYSGPFLYFGLLTWLQNAAERYALEAFNDSDAVAAYSILLQLGAQSQYMLFGILSYFFLPAIFKSQSKKCDRSANDSILEIHALLAVLITGLMAVFVFWTYPKEIVFLLSSDKYQENASLLPYFAVGGLFFNLALVVEWRFMACLRTDLMLAPKTVFAMVGIILAFAFAYQSGLTGVLISFILSRLIYFLHLLMQWMLFQRKEKLGGVAI